MVVQNANLTKCNETTINTKDKHFSLKIIPLIYNWQQRHGIRHGDYQNYRHFCSRKIQRIRKTLHYPVISKNKVISRYVDTNSLKDIRCWAYATELKQESNTEPRKKYRTKNRLKKLCLYALQLKDLIADNSHILSSSKSQTDNDAKRICDTRSIIESQAYYYWAMGNWYFECGEWDKCQIHMMKSKYIYDELCSMLQESTSKIYGKNIMICFKQRKDDIETAIRFSHYNLSKTEGKMETNADSDNIANVTVDKDMFETKIKALIGSLKEEMKQNGVHINNILSTEPSQAIIHTENCETFPQFLKQCYDLEQALIKEIFHHEPHSLNTRKLSSIMIRNVDDAIKPSKKTDGVMTGRKSKDFKSFKCLNYGAQDSVLIKRVLAIYDKLLSLCSYQLKKIKILEKIERVENQQDNNFQELKRYHLHLRNGYLLGRRIFFFHNVAFFSQYLPALIFFRAKTRGKRTAFLFRKSFCPYLVRYCDSILQCLRRVLANIEPLPEVLKGPRLVQCLQFYIHYFQTFKFKMLGDYYSYKNMCSTTSSTKLTSSLKSAKKKFQPQNCFKSIRKRNKYGWNSKPNTLIIAATDKADEFYKLCQNFAIKCGKDETRFWDIRMSEILTNYNKLYVGAGDLLLPGFSNHISCADIIPKILDFVSRDIDRKIENLKIKKALKVTSINFPLDKTRVVTLKISIISGQRFIYQNEPILTLVEYLLISKLNDANTNQMVSSCCIRIPPPMKPVLPCKPAFFDVARDQIHVFMNKYVSNLEKTDNSSTSGSSLIGGMVKKLFWK
ncbi:unnamed protein product [Gordionus sp. m RMFG-2023]|uniref:uncharacterized protein LOC135926163 isoform X2 n=1 Tax=Gordionus sp. m RMFG-2023 TaxID=3053472 RepID=UPI0030E2A489